MKQSKKAFTIVELIFVILIIGILSAVAIPRLMATRDDAKIAVSLSEVGRLVSELSIYYTSQGNFSENLKKMTSVKDVNYTTPWNSTTQSAVLTYYTPKNRSGYEGCFSIYIQNEDGNMSISNVSGRHENVCSGLQKIKVYQKLLGRKSLIGNNIF